METHPVKNKTRMLLIFSLFSLVALISYPVTAARTSEPRTIAVSGEGKASAEPDLVEVSFGVSLRASSVEAAMKAQAEKMDSLIKRLKGLGIPDKNLQTSGLSLYADEERDKSGNPTGKKTYKVDHQVNVKIEEIKKTGKIIDEAMSAGANHMYGPYFSLKDSSKLENLARKDAINDAKMKAKELALAQGVSLGEVISISEGGAFPPPLFGARKAMMMVEGAAETSISTGTLEKTVSVQVVYSID